MGWKSILGTISPLYGAVSGEGQMGKMLNPSKAAEIAAEEQARNAAAMEQANTDRQNQIAAQAAQAQNRGMKKGGKVKAKSASARADGCAIRGKTRA